MADKHQSKFDNKLEGIANAAAVAVVDNIDTFALVKSRFRVSVSNIPQD